IMYFTVAYSSQVQVWHILSWLFQVIIIGPYQSGYSPLLDNSSSYCSVGAVAYVNLYAQMRLWEQGQGRLELFGVVNNLFDKDPPNDLPSSFGPTNNVLYDVVGRSFKVGVRFSY